MDFVSDTIFLNSSTTFRYSFQIELLREDWAMVNSKNLYLSIDYLKALENSFIDNISYVYLVVYQNKIPVTIVYFQWIKVHDNFFTQEKFPKEIKSKLLLNLLKKNKGSLLLCGNFFATGVNGYDYLNNYKIKPEVLLSVTDKLSRLLSEKNSVSHIKLMLFKEFLLEKEKSVQKKLEKKTRRFQIDVNMVLKLKENWISFEMYLESMTTKYRTKAKSIYKKTENIISKEFTAEEIHINSLEIEKLFASVLNTASFNMLELTVTSFYQLKKQLKDQFVFTAYFIESKMIGFSTACINYSYLDANYVGIDYKVNKQYPLYQRILFDYVKLAINKQAKELRLGRTAETIKSSLGAVPVEMNLYLKHINPFAQFVLSPLLKYVKPSHFELRSPFKRVNKST